MKKIMTFLSRLGDRPTPQIPESWLQYADRYFRKGRHHISPDSVSGYDMRAWLKNNLDIWEEVKDRHGIQAAIALGY